MAADDDDRRVEAGVVERHAEDGQEDERRESAGGALHAGVGSARDQQQRDRDQVAEGRDEDGPTREAAKGQEDGQRAGHEDGQAEPSSRPGLVGPGGRAALAWATAASPMKMKARTKTRRRDGQAALPVVLFHGGLRWRSLRVRSLRTSVGHPVPSNRAKARIVEMEVARPSDGGRPPPRHEGQMFDQPRPGVVDPGPTGPGPARATPSKAPRNGVWPFTSLRRGLDPRETHSTRSTSGNSWIRPEPRGHSSSKVLLDESVTSRSASSAQTLTRFPPGWRRSPRKTAWPARERRARPPLRTRGRRRRAGLRQRDTRPWARTRRPRPCAPRTVRRGGRSGLRHRHPGRSGTAAGLHWSHPSVRIILPPDRRRRVCGRSRGAECRRTADRHGTVDATDPAGTAAR